MSDTTDMPDTDNESNTSDTPDTLDILREKNVVKIDKLLNDTKKSELLEQGIYDHTLRYSEINGDYEYMIEPIYTNKIDEIIFQMDSEHKLFSETFYNKIINDEIDLSDVPYLRPYETNPPKWTDILERKKYNDDLKTNKITTDVYKCPRCGERKCTVCQKQTRAADESMTTFVTCIVCSYVMKF
jgi:DNA-directed RNA polymerase subunit M/transcription elongation factor TFIIS